MRSVYTRLIVTVLISTSLGVGATAIVASSENGYVAGFVILPLFLLIGLTSLILIVAGLITLGVKGEYGLWLLLAAVLIPGSFLFSAMTAKEFELGAYREEPMVPIASPIANKVLFNKEASHEEIEMFWTHIIGYPTDNKGGHWSRPGVSGGFRPPDENGHEVIVFSFRPEATDDQKNDIRERIKNYPPVFQYLEDVDTTSPTPESPLNDSNTANRRKVVSATPN